MTMTFGQAVRAERERQQLTQKELAQRGFYECYKDISEIERDRRNITWNRMKRIAKALGCDLIITLEPLPSGAANDRQAGRCDIRHVEPRAGTTGSP